MLDLVFKNYTSSKDPGKEFFKKIYRLYCREKSAIVYLEKY